MKKITFLFIFLGLIHSYIFSGELANFEIVGFSSDMKYFSFAEYGLSEDANLFANLYVINVRKNYFVHNGVFQNKYNIKPQLTENGIGALFSTLLQAHSTLKQYNIDTLDKGKLIYILLDGEVPTSEINFTDFDTGTEYVVSLQQHMRTNSVNQPEAKMVVDLTVLYKGNQHSFVVGNKGFYRPFVEKYVLRSIYTNLDNRSLIFVIEKHSISQIEVNEYNIHYMVETIFWR